MTKGRWNAIWPPDCLPAEYPLSLDLVLAHRLRLESLLDSALATLALIHDTAPDAAPGGGLHFHGSRGSVKAQPDGETPSPSLSPPQPILARRDLIFRFNRVPEPPTGRLPPVAMFLAIQEGLRSRGLDVDSVRWLHNGDLTINFASPEKVKVSQVKASIPTIWAAIQPLLKLPKDAPCPRADIGRPWHSVDVHKGPVPGQTTESEISWLRKGAYNGSIEDVVALCNNEELSTRGLYRTVCRFDSGRRPNICRTRALLFGAQCGASNYVPKLRSPSKSPGPM
ncbi:hypothetical protein B0H14DRAFT_3511739 [Mycena olivaceomarginata]|nr:hypothetical protein B0H14DRAFT_3511739 [Mycena olivaceomarginata]